MQRFISTNLWSEIARLAKRSRTRKAAVAYVTSETAIRFGEGDMLIADASERAIASGSTSARTLRAAFKRGAEIHHCDSLHAKVMLFGDVAVIGSANISESSASDLVEAALVTDHAPTVSAAASFIGQLAEHSSVLGEADFRRLCAIKVERKAARRRAKRRPQLQSFEQRTWVVGVHEISEPTDERERAKIDVSIKAAEELRSSTRSDIGWMKWSGVSRFRREARAGDTVIQIWRASSRAAPSVVYRRASILLREDVEKHTRFYIEESADAEKTALSWKGFQTLLRRAGFTGEARPGMARLLDEDVADLLFSLWKTRR